MAHAYPQMKDLHCYIFILSLKDGFLIKRKNIRLSCDHKIDHKICFVISLTLSGIRLIYIARSCDHNPKFQKYPSLSVSESFQGYVIYNIACSNTINGKTNRSFSLYLLHFQGHVTIRKPF